jgi:two-component system CheB/CheR fusion protein
VQVVAIGASAGGMEAFRLFLEKMPGDRGMGFVVVSHLSADRKTMLAEIISRCTRMPVAEAADNDRIEPDQVYVIPPGAVATLHDGRLRLRRLAPEVPREAAPIRTSPI